VRGLTALEAIGRGTANVRGNPQLVVVSVAGTAALLVLVLLSFLPWMATLGVDFSWLDGTEPDAERLRALFDRFDSLDELLGTAGAFLLALTFALTLATLLYCWLQGGTLGVLVAGDAQAPAGAGRDALLFRTFSMPLFVHEAQRLVWRFLLFYSLIFAVLLALVVAVGALVVAAGALAGERGAGAGCALACGLLLPMLFVTFVVAAAIQIGQAELVRPASGVLAATRSALALLGRRIGAAAVVVVWLVGVSVALGIGFTIVGFGFDLALRQSLAAQVALRALLAIVQLAASSAVNLVFAAAFVALARSEPPATEPSAS
jgi:hypothetical protein